MTFSLNSFEFRTLTDNGFGLIVILRNFLESADIAGIVSEMEKMNEAVSFEQNLLTIKECFVYKVPPLKSASGHRAEDWGLDSPLFTGLLKVFQNDTKLRIAVLRYRTEGNFDTSTENTVPFAECPIEVKPNEDILRFVDGVIDSSRYFVVRIQDPRSTRTTLLGIGFREREDAFDLKECLNEYVRYVGRGEKARKMREAREKGEFYSSETTTEDSTRKNKQEGSVLGRYDGGDDDESASPYSSLSSSDSSSPSNSSSSSLVSSLSQLQLKEGEKVKIKASFLTKSKANHPTPTPIPTATPTATPTNSSFSSSSSSSSVLNKPRPFLPPPPPPPPSSSSPLSISPSPSLSVKGDDTNERKKGGGGGGEEEEEQVKMTIKEGEIEIEKTDQGEGEEEWGDFTS